MVNKDVIIISETEKKGGGESRRSQIDGVVSRKKNVLIQEGINEEQQMVP